MAFKMNRWSAFTKPTETNPDGTDRSNPKDDLKNAKGLSNSKQSSVWSDKATRLVEKREKKKKKGKSTERVQKRINKELAKLKMNEEKLKPKAITLSKEKLKPKAQKQGKIKPRNTDDAIGRKLY